MAISQDSVTASLVYSVRELSRLLIAAAKERGRRPDGSYLPTFGPDGRFNPDEQVALEVARTTVAKAEGHA